MRRAVAWLGAAVLAMTAAIVPLAGAPAGAPPVALQDARCPRGYPVLLPIGRSEGSVYSRALARLVVCSDSSGTATAISNRTEAVWVLDTPSHVAIHRLSSSSLTTSFLRLFASPSPAIPTGATVVVMRPASEVRVRIDAGLTLAQLTHDELARFLALGSGSGRVLDRYGDLLGACLASVLTEVGPPDQVLLSGNPAPALIDAAERLAAADGVCTAVWRAAGGQSLEDDVGAWRRHAGFAIRGMSASITYSALAQPLRVVR